MRSAGGRETNGDCGDFVAGDPGRRGEVEVARRKSRSYGLKADRRSDECHMIRLSYFCSFY